MGYANTKGDKAVDASDAKRMLPGSSLKNMGRTNVWFEKLLVEIPSDL
jgi:hypothetical protein